MTPGRLRMKSRGKGRGRTKRQEQGTSDCSTAFLSEQVIESQLAIGWRGR